MNTEALMVVFKIGIYVVTGWCVGTMIGYAFDALRNVVREWRCKHRFDKPPTAACYCIDCKWHSVKDNQCNNVTWADRHTPDNGFCYDAEPRKKDDDKANIC